MNYPKNKQIQKDNNTSTACEPEEPRFTWKPIQNKIMYPILRGMEWELHCVQVVEKSW